MKIAVYTICLNEDKFVQRWANSNTDADVRLVCDTGSTDSSIQLLKDNHVDVFSISVNPWRFDVARNASLSLLPADVDICICQDIDEILLPGWRESLEKNWKDGTTVANHRYRNNGSSWIWHNKIHARHGCRWTGPVHEEIKWDIPESQIWLQDFYLDEIQDTSKDRNTYIPLLLKKIQEGDNSWRTWYFLANDYRRIGNIDKSIDARKTALSLCKDGSEVCSYISKNIASDYEFCKKLEEAEHWHKQSVFNYSSKEGWFSYAEFLFRQERWDECYVASINCIKDSRMSQGFTHDPRAWQFFIYDYAAISAYKLGMLSKAKIYGEEAVRLNPNDERLKTNLKFYSTPFVQ